jgi:tetratricopeptide (TPR) repeat protein
MWFDSMNTHRSKGGVAMACVAALWLMTTGVTCDQDRALAVQRLNEGLAAYQRGQTQDAVAKLKEAAQADADFAKPRYQLGQIYEMKYEDAREAERFYRAALDIHPKRAEYGYALGRLLVSNGDYEEAIRVLQETTDAHPKHAKSWYRLGEAQAAMGHHPKAVEAYMKSIEADARMTFGEDDAGGVAYHALGDLYVTFGFPDKALKVYDNGITNNPEAARMYRGRGVAELELKQFEAATRSFRKALELGGDGGAAYFNLAAALEGAGRPQEAIQALEKYLDIADSTDRARISVAQGMIQKLKADTSK